MRHIFIDGYNVVNSWPELSEIKNYSLESSRQKLIEVLQNYASYKGYKIFLVFDAHMVPKSMEKRERYGDSLVVIFTKEGETADSFIERKVNNSGRKMEICVVTSDALEQQLVFQRGAIRMSSLEFYYEVISTNQRINTKIEKNEVKKRNTIEDRITGEILEKLEKIRKSN
ncbi:NYN domain-containing protein [Clostridium rectalis]|uniref:NYN domain-containing protein n=1 Tax=Clostridium rectalis TaxID=2040295 RepID=UPI000F630176|nr:NYN domain-containing protein [Clostridium rectalis]